MFIILQINDTIIKLTSPVILLGNAIGSKLKFKEHADNIIQKAGYKVHTMKGYGSF